MPLYYIAYTWSSDQESYWSPLTRQVPTHYAASILPATLLGYALPTLLMFLPWMDPAMIQNFVALYQPALVFVPLLTMAFSTLYRWKHPKRGAYKLPRADKKFSDMKHLKRLYMVTFVLGGALHIYIMLKLLMSADPIRQFSSVFVPDFRAGRQMLGEGNRNLIVADFWVFNIASCFWCCCAVWDLKRVGRTTVDPWKASAAILLANFILGPGAAMVAVWYWREEAMARTSFGELQVGKARVLATGSANGSVSSETARCEKN